MKRTLAYGMSLLLLWSLSPSPAPADVVRTNAAGGGVGLGDANTWTNTNTFSGSMLVNGSLYFDDTASTHPVCSWNAAQTVDTLTCGLGTTSRALVLHEAGDEAFDFAHGQATHPTLFIHSSNQSTAQYLSFAHNGADAVVHTATGRIVFTAGFRSNVTAGLLMDEDAPIHMGGTSTYRIITNSTQTNRMLQLMTNGADGNAVVLSEVGDASTNWGHADQANPTLFIQSTNTTATEYQKLNAFSSQSEYFKALTESAATSVVRIAVAASSFTGGTIHYTIVGADATDQQVRSGFIRFAVSNKASTETCGMTNDLGVADASISELEDGNASSISAGTLTYDITCDTTPANAVDIQINAVSSLTQTTLRAYWRVLMNGPGTITPNP